MDKRSFSEHSARRVVHLVDRKATLNYTAVCLSASVSVSQRIILLSVSVSVVSRLVSVPSGFHLLLFWTDKEIWSPRKEAYKITYTHMQAHTQTWIHARPRTQSDGSLHERVIVVAPLQILAALSTRQLKHTYTRTHARTHTHAHTHNSCWTKPSLS